MQILEEDDELLNQELIQIQNVEEDFQHLEQAQMRIETNPSEKFIVHQITANDLLGSFLAQ